MLVRRKKKLKEQLRYFLKKILSSSYTIYEYVQYVGRNLPVAYTGTATGYHTSTSSSRKRDKKDLKISPDIPSNFQTASQNN